MSRYLVTYHIFRSNGSRTTAQMPVTAWSMEDAIQQARDTLDIITDHDEYYQIAKVEEVDDGRD